MNDMRTAVLALAIITIGGLLSYRALSPLPTGTPSIGGSSMVLTNIAVEPFYFQGDARWGKDPIGGSAETLSAVGCTVASLSMAATQLGVPMNPGQLNAKLKEADGYTDRGWLKWDVASMVLGDSVDIDVPRRPSHRQIDAALKAGDLVIAKVLLWGSVPHWVLIVGKDGAEYLIKNPLATEGRIQVLSELSETIEAIRIVRD
jgi:hypothetical protein